MKVPQLLRPSLFRDVTNGHCGLGPLWDVVGYCEILWDVVRYCVIL